MNTAEDISTTLSDESPSVEPVDAIADLLIGDDESNTEDASDEETQTAASTPDDEDSNDEDEADDGEEEETSLEAVEDGDTTWEGVLGVSEDSMSFDESGNVTGFKTKVNGEEETVSAKDLIAGYQNNKHVTQKSQAHAETVKQFEVQREQVMQEYSSKLASVDALTQHFEAKLISEYDGVNWDALRVEDPAEYAAARHDFSMKANELQNIKAAIATDKSNVDKTNQEAMHAKQQEYLKSQYDQMIEKNPEWSDEKTRNAARDGFKSFVQEQYGFTDAEWDTVYDARLIELVKDAKKYRDGATVASKKRDVPVPKFQKSRGGPQKRKVSKLEKLTKAASVAKGDTKRDLQAGAVAELLLGAK